MTPEMAINITRLSVAFSFCWPVPASSSRGRVLFMKIVLVVATISGFMLVSLLMYGAYVHFGDLILTSKCVCLTMCVSQFVMQTIICLAKYETLQHVVDELMTYVKQAQQYERDTLCTYIDKCNRFYGGYIAVVYTTLIAFLLGPLVVPVPFPLDAEYPFSVNYTPVASTFLHGREIRMSGYGVRKEQEYRYADSLYQETVAFEKIRGRCDQLLPLRSILCNNSKHLRINLLRHYISYESVNDCEAAVRNHMYDRTRGNVLVRMAS
ncbi:hypothetical protein QLX08_004136 [Tetragonisca angustula]|uniref:Odorant receptor n=1 Tax=Tetragonisca angustula TaxID=166442 RepID=A0AAW1A391_9HYME